MKTTIGQTLLACILGSRNTVIETVVHTITMPGRTLDEVIWEHDQNEYFWASVQIARDADIDDAGGALIGAQVHADQLPDLSVLARMTAR